MALTRETITTFAETPGTNVITKSVSTGSGSDRVLFLLLISGRNDSTPGTDLTVTYNGVAMDLLQWNDEAFNAYPCVLYGLANPASGANNLVITDTSPNTIEWYGAAIPYSGAHQTLGDYTSTKATGTSTSPSLSISSATGDEVLGMIAFGHGSGQTIGVGADQTQLAEKETTFPQFNISYEPGASSVTHSYSLSATPSGWVLLAVSVKTKAASGHVMGSLAGGGGLAGRGGLAGMGGGLVG